MASSWKTGLEKQAISIAKTVVSLIFLVTARFLTLFLHESSGKGRHLLILKPASLGDYFLFRNYLKLLRNSEQFSSYTITLCAGSNIRETAETLDRDSFDEFLPVFYPRILYDLPHFLSVVRLLYRKYDTVIHPVYSREFVPDLLARFACRGTSVAFAGDHNNMGTLCRLISDRWYTKLIGDEGMPVFDFHRTGHFFTGITGQASSLKAPLLENPEKYLPHDVVLPATYAVLFPGALQPFRRWPAERFALLAQHLALHHNLQCVVAGGPGDRESGRIIAASNPGGVTDLTGRISIPQLAGVLSKARILISNDTLAVHAGASVGIPIVVISQMNYFHRFVPYPPSTGTRMRCVVPASFRHLSADEAGKKFSKGSLIDISVIPFNDVRETTDQLLHETA